MNVEIYWLLSTIIGTYQFIIILDFILTLLINFNVVNRSNQLVATVHRITYALTEPVLRPIRRVIPLIGGVDLSPMVLLIGLEFIKRILARVLVLGF
jgi:YggT family protein